MHFMCFLKSHPGKTGPFHNWFLEIHAPQLKEHAPDSLQRMVVSIAETPSEDFTVYGGQERNAGMQKCRNAEMQECRNAGMAYDVLLQV